MPGLLVMLACLLLTETSLLSSLNWYAYDLGMRFSSDQTAGEEIVVVAIDDKSLRELGAWPWPRNILAEATAIIVRSRPKVLGLTIPFDVAQGTDQLETIKDLREVLKKQRVLKSRVRKALDAAEARLDTDQQLASTLNSSVRIVLAMPYVEGSRLAESESLPDYLQKFTLSGWSEIALTGAETLYPPIELLSKQVSGVGVTNARVNAKNHSHHYPLVVRYGDDYLPSFELMMAARYLGLSPQHIRAEGDSVIKLGEKMLATDPSYMVYPRFYSGENGQPAFKVISMIELLNGKVPSSELRRKTVIVGVTSDQHVVTKMTPFGEDMSPTMVAAHTVSSLLNEEVYRVPSWAARAQQLAIVLIGLYLMFLLTRLRKTTGLFISIFLLLIMANAHFILMSSKATWVPLMTAILALIAGHAIVGGRQMIVSRVSGVQRALSEANRQLGQSFQMQGQLDQAFEKFKQCEVDDAILGQLYNLGLDYERKRQFNKAVSVFKFIQNQQAKYSDVAERIDQNKQASEAVVLGSGGPSAGMNATLVIDNGGMQKPMLGRYQIDKEIGRGAMGMVYLGRDEKIGRVVAVKTMAMRDDLEPDKLDEVKARFFREAEAAGRLNHPNIVTVYDVGDEQDLAYIAMDYLKGKDLTAYCSPKTLLPVATVFEIIMSIAKALEYAHEQHVVHRDIKPANIIYHAAKKTAKITDFGVACLTDASKTKTGTVLGSPYYMSPEQLAGNKVDGRADIYSLGVTFYQLLAGELPFTSDSMANLMYKIANEKHPDIRSYRPDVPSCVSKIINRSLHKDVEKRFQSGEQMAASMKRCYDRIIEGN